MSRGKGRSPPIVIPKPGQFEIFGRTQITAPDGVTLDYGYSGALPTQTAWSGPVSGTVGFTHDTDFRVNAITVNGANPVAYHDF
jgi:hypothetical protein